MPHPDRLVCIDFEATSLSPVSFPIELGWAVAELAKPRLVASGAIMIRPLGEDWEPSAEALHGLSRARLMREGTGPAEALETFEAAVGRLSDIRLVADSELDDMWLRRLVEAAIPATRQSQRPAWRVEDFHLVLGRLTRDVGRSRRLLQDLHARPQAHRAEPDARRLAQTLIEAVSRKDGGVADRI